MIPTYFLSLLRFIFNIIVIVPILVLSDYEMAMAGKYISSWVKNNESRLRLITNSEFVSASGQTTIGLQLQLNKGWKTYWRSPGAAGYPISLNLENSVNLENFKLFHPIPYRFSFFDMETFGYTREVIFPINITTKDPLKDLYIKGSVSYLLCGTICIPREEIVSIHLKPSISYIKPSKTILDSYIAKVPGLGAEKGLELTSAYLKEDYGNKKFVVIARSTTDKFVDPDLIIEGPSGLEFSKPIITLGDNNKKASFVINVTNSSEDSFVIGKALTLSIIDGDRGLEIQEIVKFKP